MSNCLWWGSVLLLASASLQAAEPRFFRGMNLNGPAVVIDGRQWEGRDSPRLRSEAAAFENQSVSLRPPTDPQRALMIRSSRWGRGARLTFTEVPGGEYTVFVYVWEDNDPETISLELQGKTVAQDISSGQTGEWRRRGPFVVAVDQSREIVLSSQGGAANLSGIEIWSGVGDIPEPGTPVEKLPAVEPALAKLFEEQVAPLISQHCLDCHNQNQSQGGLDLSNWQPARAGGDSGPAWIAGKPDESLLWERVAANEMPQDRPPLSDAEKALFKQWIEAGAPWSLERIDPYLTTTRRRAGYDWWSLQPIRHATPPAVAQTDGLQNEIDAFVRSRLEQAGLTPAPEADRRTLIRRLAFDLTGLPPSPAEVARFETDTDPLAYDKLVDRLLDSPHYGERWARHWLDVIRFGESQGYERNRIRDNIWRYRDWVIDAFNQNLPYDEFVRQQIAGDVLRPEDASALIATGYHVCGAWDQVAFYEGSAEMKRAARQDAVEDLIATLGQAFLGLTVNCARCHDHKFDPIPQRDYYRLAALLGGVNQQEKEQSGISVRGGSLTLPLQGFDGTAHVVIPQTPPTTYVLARGDYREPRDVADPAGLSAFERAGLSADLELPPDASDADRRRGLAEWLTSPRNPLVARVFVNRVWYYHFGEGLVDTPSDFGFNGGRPSHPELLDELAARFIESGWDVKQLQRRIVLSATYRQTSRRHDPLAEQVDADNRWLWRANRQRLTGEAIRDSILAVSGNLNPEVGGPSFRDVNVALKTNHEFTTPTNEFSPATCRRSIYRLWARSGNNPLMECLDCPDPTVMTPRRTRTITPLQALSLFNNQFVERCAGTWADRVRKEAGDDVAAQIRHVYQAAFSRNPTPEELSLAQSFVPEFGLEQLCLTLFNTNEFLLVE